MALIVEDGSGVTNANSYAGVATIRSFATARGIVLSASDADVEVLAIKAMDYIEAKYSEYQGAKTSAEQSLQFPRDGLYIDGYLVANNVIPITLIRAQCQLACDSKDTELQPTSTGYAIHSEKTDVLETTYATGGSQTAIAYPASPIFVKAEAFLKPLYKSIAAITVVRV